MNIVGPIDTNQEKGHWMGYSWWYINIIYIYISPTITSPIPRSALKHSSESMVQGTRTYNWNHGMRLFTQGIGKFTNVEMYGKCIYKRGYNGNIIGYVIWCDWCVWKLVPWNFHGLKHPKYFNFKHTHIYIYIASDIDTTQVIPSVCQVLSWKENVGVGPGRWFACVLTRTVETVFSLDNVVTGFLY